MTIAEGATPGRVKGKATFSEFQKPGNSWRVKRSCLARTTIRIASLLCVLKVQCEYRRALCPRHVRLSRARVSHALLMRPRSLPRNDFRDVPSSPFLYLLIRGQTELRNRSSEHPRFLFQRPSCAVTLSFVKGARAN